MHMHMHYVPCVFGRLDRLGLHFLRATHLLAAVIADAIRSFRLRFITAIHAEQSATGTERLMEHLRTRLELPLQFSIPLLKDLLL